MEIKINDKTLDVSLDNENTVGDVLTGLERWLSDAGHRISELSIDGEMINASMIEGIFKKEIKNIKCLDIKTNVVSDLTAASLLNLLEDIKEYESCDFDAKSKYYEKWKSGATAGFIHEELPELFAFCHNTFGTGEIPPDVLRSVTEEIQREVNDPSKELSNLEPVLDEICERLIRLPLDIQTGKDAVAAQTMQIFAAITEKIIRIFRQLDIQGYFINEKESESKEQVENRKNQLLEKISAFSNILRELLEAYEKNDSVLVGDITEYEASPKLKDLYAAILENIQLSPNKQDDK
ncbi:MAG: hypothetical protein FWC01_01810 [Treponema sp.]|nr:hypothetical protein [Treponema sp.]MCL2236828.1 hypothetical protein [Treponema sp.]